MYSNKDRGLRKLAGHIANFQSNLAAYIIVNLLLWVTWWFTTNNRSLIGNTPWPAWVMFVWGIILLFQFIRTYGEGRDKLVDKDDNSSANS